MENDHEPATKADLAEVKTELAAVRGDVVSLNQAVASVKQDVDMLRSEVHHGYDDLKETLRDVQTELLKAFYSFTESTHNNASRTRSAKARRSNSA